MNPYKRPRSFEGRRSWEETGRAARRIRSAIERISWVRESDKCFFNAASSVVRCPG